MSRSRGPRAPAFGLLVGLALVLAAGCGSTLDSLRGSPSATPADFTGLTHFLANHNLAASDVVSGDAGCNDRTLAPTAISFHIAGAGIPAPVVARVYLFLDDAAYSRLRASVDTCAAAWITDRSTLLMIDASPYVLVTDGITDQGAIDALRAAMHEAAGN